MNFYDIQNLLVLLSIIVKYTIIMYLISFSFCINIWFSHNRKQYFSGGLSKFLPVCWHPWNGRVWAMSLLGNWLLYVRTQLSPSFNFDARIAPRKLKSAAPPNPALRLVPAVYYYFGAKFSTGMYFSVFGFGFGRNAVIYSSQVSPKGWVMDFHFLSLESTIYGGDYEVYFFRMNNRDDSS